MVDIVLSCQVNIQHIRDALHGLQCIRTILNYFSKVHMSNVDKFMSNSKIYFFYVYCLNLAKFSHIVRYMYALNNIQCKDFLDNIFLFYKMFAIGYFQFSSVRSQRTTFNSTYKMLKGILIKSFPFFVSS